MPKKAVSTTQKKRAGMKLKPDPEPDPEPESDDSAEEEGGAEEEIGESEEGEDDEEESSGGEGVEEGEEGESSGGEDDADADSEDDSDDDEFEDQGSSSDEDERFAQQAEVESEDESGDESGGGLKKRSSGVRGAALGNEDGDNDEEEAGDADGEQASQAVEEKGPRHWSIRSKEVTVSREHELAAKRADGSLAVEQALHVDDLSSDDEEAGNAVGRVPLRWYENLEHIGYGLDGKRILRKAGLDGLDKALAAKDDPNFKRTVYDALNDKEVVLSDRDLEVIRRLQAGAFAHPEHDAHPDYIPYFSEVDKHQMPLSESDPFKRRFVPSKWELIKVTRIIKGLRDGTILPLAEQKRLKAEAKETANAPSLIWSVEDDELDGLDTRKGPMHIAAPKLALPGHAMSYRPPDEYLFTKDEEKAWREADPEDREQDFLPVKHDSLRAVGAYGELVRERFERCLDLYLCPRSFKRRLQIDPESLVPKLPSPKDLRPFPTTACVRFTDDRGGGTAHDRMIRCLSPSLDGQWLASGDAGGTLRLWEVATGRCVRKWKLAQDGHHTAVNLDDAAADADAADDADAVAAAASSDDDGDDEEATTPSTKAASVSIAHVCWCPNKLHHVLLVAAGNAVFVVATGTGGAEASEVTDALLHACESNPSGPPFSSTPGGGEGDASSSKANAALANVTWAPTDANALAAKASNGSESSKSKRKKGKASQEGGEEAAVSSSSSSSSATSVTGHAVGVRCVLRFKAAVTSLCWHRKGDYFATAVPGADTGNVMVHQLSKRVTQVVVRRQMKTVCALAFHPNQPVFFVATQQHVKVYHLVEQKLLKKLLTGCKHVSSMDVHPSGDHVLIGSYDRRCVWFDLDRGALPYKTLKYHTKALRQVGFHKKYPLMATCSDDNSVHVFHATVYSDLMKDPLIVPVKVLKGEHLQKKQPGGGKAAELGVLAMAFHPTQPWLFSAGADGTVVLYQDL